MKKTVVIVQSKDSDSTVEKIRSLGLLHVEHQRAPKAQNITSLKEKIEMANKTILILSSPEFSEDPKKIQAKEPSDWEFIAHHIIDCDKRLSQLEEYSRRLKSDIIQWQDWGDFDPDDIKALASQNIYLRLFHVPEKDAKKFPADCIVTVMSRSKGMVRCVVTSREKIEIPFKEIRLPKMGLEKMRARLAEDNRCVELIKSDIKKQNAYRESLISVKKSLEKDLEFQEAIKGMGSQESLDYIKGYIPVDSKDVLMNAAKTEQWGIIIGDPSDEDNVPTLVRNPGWASWIQPLFKAIELVPGYRELDTSLWFLIFLSIFFGMLIGDAAYGTIFLLLTAFTHVKFKTRLKDVRGFKLLYLFSAFAIIWGFLTGTFFGQAWLPQWVKPLFPVLRSDATLQTLCFLIGTLHLSIAHTWRALIKFPSLETMAEVGWISILWGGFHLARTLILSVPFPEVAQWLFIVGILFVIFFSSIKKNVFVTVGRGVGSLLMNIVNSFTDIVSYIRLFAVGLATVAVADAFNKMAFEAGGAGGFAALGLSALILFIGHALNIILGPMSVLVHGIRLNVLEFSNHLDVKWSGFEYKPLRS